MVRLASMVGRAQSRRLRLPERNADISHKRKRRGGKRGGKNEEEPNADTVHAPSYEKFLV